ncbi:MAG: ABC transporter permease [Ruminococcus sp.]|nr:ABC transporter permease [Ruminococcus sp.]
MKFFNLLKKELAELITAQTIIGLIVTMALFMFLGNVMSTTMEEVAKKEYSISLINRDKTDLTKGLIDALKSSNTKVTEYNISGDDYSEILKETGKETIIIIPEDFTEKIENGEAPELISIAGMESSAMMSNLTNSNNSAINLIKNCLSMMLADKAGLSSNDIGLINSPIKVSEHTVVSDKSANASAESIMSSLMSQSMILPIIVFVLIMMTSQMLMSAISNEKIDKTLETLLSAPVSRTAILGAKMLAAAIVALLNAVFYTIGFSSFMSGTTNVVTEEMTSSISGQYISVDEALNQLGLSLGAGDYILVGLQLFLTIMICLSISLMLGALVNDTKQAQTMVMPLMFMAMIPYIISMLSDINTLPIVIKILVYAIPFTHTFSAMSNLMFGHLSIFFGGLIYQTIAFAVCMFFALKLFKSDKILTASLNLGQKSRFKRSGKTE